MGFFALFLPASSAWLHSRRVRSDSNPRRIGTVWAAVAPNYEGTEWSLDWVDCRHEQGSGVERTCLVTRPGDPFPVIRSLLWLVCVDFRRRRSHTAHSPASLFANGPLPTLHTTPTLSLRPSRILPRNYIASDPFPLPFLSFFSFIFSQDSPRQ